MDKYDDFYGWWSWYNRRLFLRFLAFVAALFFFNEREGWLFFANANDVTTLQDHVQLYQELLWENSIIDSSVKVAE